jgi:hypothetical protein
MEHCIDAAKVDLHEADQGRDLKACIIGVLGDDPRSKTMGAALLAAAASDLALLEVIRERIARYTQEFVGEDIDFARAAIVSLAVDGLKMRESLRISPFTEQQRAQIVQELLKMADECFGSAA